MAKLLLPDKSTLSDFEAIQDFLAQRAIPLEQWKTDQSFDSDETLLDAYAHQLQPLMAERGYQTADVLSVHPNTPNLAELREKFMREHTHSEDEVRFFVEGEGFFWFHLEDETFCVHCEAGDFLAVPAGFKHWFDLGPHPMVKVIRIFTDPAGWVPHYTDTTLHA